jgi:hypothetical protein
MQPSNGISSKSPPTSQTPVLWKQPVQFIPEQTKIPLSQDLHVEAPTILVPHPVDKMPPSTPSSPSLDQRPFPQVETLPPTPLPSPVIAAVYTPPITPTCSASAPPAISKSPSPVLNAYSDITPIPSFQPLRKALISSASLTGTLNIADSFHSQISLEFAGEGLVEFEVTALKDTGAEIDIVASSLVDELIRHQLAVPFALDSPVLVGAVDTDDAFTITQAISLPIRENDVFYEHVFGIGPLPAPPHIIMGTPWISKYCPEALKHLQDFGKISLLSSPPVSKLKDSDTPVTPTTHSPSALGQGSPPVLPESEILSFGPCKDPITAFSAGGGVAAIDSEIYLRETASEKAVACLKVLSAIAYRLDTLKATAHIRATTTDPGVRGLTGNSENWLETIPLKFRHFAHSVFSDEAASVLPPHRPNIDCEIHTREGAKFTSAKVYDMSSEQLTILKQLLDAELAKGFIRPSKAEHSSPVFFVTDPSTKQQRLVVDFRKRNEGSISDDYALPLTSQIMRGLTKAKIFTKFDVRSGFSNIRMAPGHEPATAFKTFYGLYEYQVMPMGLATAPAVFQRFMNSILAPCLDLFCFVYLDDIIVFSNTQEEHDKHVTRILEILEANQLHLKPSKCVWSVSEITFLGFTAVAGKGIRMSDDKVLKITSLPSPRTVTEVRETLGLINFYGHFIPHYSDICAPINALTGKDVPFVWSDTCEAAFRRLLSLVRTDVFLSAFDPKLPTTLETDSSDVAYGGVISQPGPDGKLRPVIMFHHKFKSHEKNWDIHDKELWAIVYAFDHFRHFLTTSPDQPVSVITDHRNLAKFMFTTDLLKSHDGRLARWWTQLSGLNFRIEYRPGSENVVSDFLSRYQQDASDPEGLVLLPAHRFSTKALADITSWFKKSGDKNIRQILEDSFQSKEKKNSSPVPVPAPPPSPSVSSARTFRIFEKQERLVEDSLNPRQLHLAYSLGLPFYSGAPLAPLLDSSNARRNGDFRGLGHP